MAGVFNYQTNRQEALAKIAKGALVLPREQGEEIAVLGVLADKSRGTREPLIKFFRPSQLRSYEPEKDIVLVGDCHVMRGEVFVIGGEPGVGKSTAATELAFSGATGRDWLGLPVHARFRTMIIQTENGCYRLRDEYRARGLADEIEDYILVSEPPPYGLTLGHSDFQSDIKTAIDEFRPDVVILDPWNAAAKDDKQADYIAAFDSLRNILPKGKDRPALGIVAHTRKPKPDEKRIGGTGLMHLLAGSYILSSVPRTILIMVPGTAEETDNSVVLFNPKNSNGPCAGRTAWERKPSGFNPLPDFDWQAFDNGKGGRKVIRFEHIREAL